jgi:SSS family solute:Na+ symporter
VHVSIIGCTLLSAGWLVMGTLADSEAYDYNYLGIEPFYPGLFLAIFIWLVGRDKQKKMI